MSARGSGQQPAKFYKGPLAWMAQNMVASNLLMAMFILGGLLMIPRIKQEVFPEITLDTVSVSIVYPGASPAEVEQGTVLAIEEAIRGVDGIKKVTSTANESSAAVNAELLLSADKEQAYNDIKGEIDRITSFPEDAEKPSVSLVSTRREVISLVLYGDQDEWTLKRFAEQVREDLLTDPDITVVEIEGIRQPEISIEVSQENLRRYNLTIEQVAGAVRLASIELPGGGIKTRAGEVLLRTNERRLDGDEFHDIIVLSQRDGTQVRLGDIATIKDGFQESDEELYFNGQRAARITVFRVGEQTPIEVSDAVKGYIDENASSLPPGLEYALWNDQSEIYRARIDLLLRNAFQGLILVLLVLGLFLELRLAFWVTLGIPISFLGAMFLMPGIDVSLNMISLFAFILTLGIVVDDAIVVGEAVFKHRKDGMGHLDAAIAGVREVGGPVIFSVLTTVFAFSPLLIVPGVMGKFFKVIPLVVIPILLISLVESLLILPAHLSHGKPPSQRGFFGAVNRAQAKFGDGLEWAVEKFYQPSVAVAIKQRYLTLAISLGMLILTVGLIGGGLVKFTFFPKIEGDVIRTSVELPFGANAEDTRAAMMKIVEGAQQTLTEQTGGEKISRGVLAQLGSTPRGGGPRGGTGSSGSHLAGVEIFLVDAGERDVTTAQFAERWREVVGAIPGVDNLSFSYDIGPGSGGAIEVELSHTDIEVLEAAAADLAVRLEDYNGVIEINDGFAAGKEQLDFKLKPAARTLGLTQTDLARQVRNAFYGAEAVRQQRGRDEVRVFVRRPFEERTSEYDIETLLLRTNAGGEIPLGQAAEVVRGRSYTSINRQDGRRLVRVTADVDTKVTTANLVVSDLKTQVLDDLISKYPGLRWDMGGQQRDQAESFGALGNGFLLALIAMFGLMAVAFRSYIQPLIIMFSIPFGIVGAVLGHLVMGYSLSFMSMMGIVALSGVVVNDSLVLVDAINSYRRGGMGLSEAVIAGGVRRFRPIMLTTLTTFFGLAPMISETSVQARFLIPMALSLGFGILFVTFIALILVPTLYMIIEDLRNAGAWISGLYDDPEDQDLSSADDLPVDHGAPDGSLHAEGDEGALEATPQPAE